MDEDAFVHMVSIRKCIYAVYVASSVNYRYCVPTV